MAKSSMGMSCAGFHVWQAVTLVVDTEHAYIQGIEATYATAEINESEKCNLHIILILDVE